MIRLAKICSILLMVVSILVYGGLMIASLAAKTVNESGSLETKPGIMVIGTNTIHSQRE